MQISREVVSAHQVILSGLHTIIGQQRPDAVASEVARGERRQTAPGLQTTSGFKLHLAVVGIRDISLMSQPLTLVRFC
jgi:hypothetical protein